MSGEIVSRESGNGKPAIIFDFGNVLAHFDHGLAAERLGRRIGCDREQAMARFRTAGLDRLARESELGTIDSAAFHAEFCDRLGLDIGFDDFAREWSDIFRLNEPVASIAGRLWAAGYTLALGSNTSALHAEFYQGAFAEALAPFEARVFSYQVGWMKPDRRFYDACVRATGYAAGASVFVDDLEENVAGAVEAGLMGVLYRDDEGLRRALWRLGARWDD
jgi:putative hydrolase of the HAD superfamily